MYLDNEPSPDFPHLDLVTGKLSLRDGSYSDDDYMKYILQGVYIWESGTLYLLANPDSMDDAVAQDYSFLLKTNTTHGFDSVYFDSPDFREFPFNNEDGDEDFHSRLCYLAISIKFDKNLDQSSLEKFVGDYTNQKPSLKFSGRLTSINCNITMDIDAKSIETDKNLIKATNYLIVATICAVIQIYFTIKQIEMSNTPTSLYKISIYSVGMHAIFDSYMCLAHITAGINSDKLNNAFFMVAFLEFVLFSIFELRFLLNVWQSSNPNMFRDGWMVAQQQITSLYLKFYVALISGFTILYWAYTMGFLNVLLFLLYSFWIPQIYHSAKMDCSRPLSLNFVIFKSLTSLFIPMYFEGCPHNFALARPHNWFVVLLCLYVIFQIVMLVLQQYLGPRFFLPRTYIAPNYDYRTPIDLSEDAMCVICRSEMKDSYLVTPCNHVFHEACLREWMDRKLECPICRNVIPPITSSV
eukprot:TRINITY_DN4466_c0_g1_i1.p1 TRINITY_DN4466_c0_g1~~TRINITY_DN4466_c0_g1_i1.p1  ORF type:complete len:467 (-),score=57.26 TRINITY_DN4466_c0_g1_i1:31-1431(-)